MVSLQLSIELENRLQDFRLRRNFAPKEWISKKIGMLNEYMRQSHLTAVVVNMSGGIDSAATIALCSAASRVENSPIRRVVGITQPIESSDWAAARAEEATKAAGAEFVTIEQSEYYRSLVQCVETKLGMQSASFARGQLKSYMRTPVAYFVAQMLASAGDRAIVVGTGNFDEDGYLRYFCKAGDGISDVQLIADLHKSEVGLISRELGVPESIIRAPPSADLWEGQSDEAELGFSYAFVELYTEYLQLDHLKREQFVTSLSPSGLQEFQNTAARVDKVHRANAHKAEYPVNLDVLSSTVPSPGP